MSALYMAVATGVAMAFGATVWVAVSRARRSLAAGRVAVATGCAGTSCGTCASASVAVSQGAALDAVGQPVQWLPQPAAVAKCSSAGAYPCAQPAA